MPLNVKIGSIVDAEKIVTEKNEKLCGTHRMVTFYDLLCLLLMPMSSSRIVQAHSVNSSMFTFFFSSFDSVR